MKKLLALTFLAFTAVAQAQWVNSVPLIDDLLWINANDTHSNVVVVAGTTLGDEYGGLFSYIKGSAAATNTIAAGGPFESLNPLSPSGRWFKLMSQGGGGVTINPTDTYIPFRTNSTTFEDSTIAMVVGNPWVLSKGLASSFYLSNTNFDYQLVMTVATGAATIQTDQDTMYLKTSTDQLNLSVNTFYPSVSGSIELGTSSHPFKFLSLTNGSAIFFGTNELRNTGTDIYWNGFKLNP